jgi:hypothetical protein
MRVGDAEAAISNETELRVTANTAFSNRLDAMDIRVGEAETSITNFDTASVNRDNAITKSVNTQYTALNKSLALAQSSITTTSNTVSSLATQYDQIQASVGDLAAALKTEAEVRATADGDLYAQYTLKLDVNGYVAGFGVANDGKVSNFIIRTDTFSIVSPTGNAAALIMQNNTLIVYDENGAPRVRIGKLS